MKCFIRILLVSASMYLCMACAADDIVTFDKKPVDFPDALIQLSGAKKVRYYEVGASMQLGYEVQSEYPAAKVIDEISKRLKKEGWEALREDFLNPGLLSSHVDGWTSFEDHSKKPYTMVHQWLADWTNERGDIVRYAFMYEYELTKPKDLSDLQVYGIFIPAVAVERDRKFFMEQEKNKAGEKK